MEWSQFISAIAGVVVGAGVSTAGQWSLARSSERREDRLELRRAAADVIGTYGLAWSALIGARKNEGPIPPDEDLGYSDRNVRYSYFAMCPGAEVHMEAFEANRLALKALVAAFSEDDEVWKRADEEMLQAQRKAQASLRDA